MNEPDWLVTARAKGLIANEQAVAPLSQSLPKAPPPADPGREAKLDPAPSQDLSKLTLLVTISPLRLASEANAGGKLRDKITRKSAVKTAVKAALPELRFPLPCIVLLTRVGGKKLDDDNHRRAMKAVRDVVAKWLGCDDADKRIVWKYRQEPGYISGCKIRIQEA